MMKKTLFVLSLLYILGCQYNQQASVEPDPEKRAQEKLADMEKEIRELVSNKNCGGQGQCKAIAFGAKPCGGPYEYLIYHTSTVDETLLKKQVAAYNAFQDSLNKKYGYVSDCAFVMEPEVGCIDDTCRVVKPYKN